MVCIYPPVVYPPACPVPPCLPLPPGGGDQCLRRFFRCGCVAGVSSWTVTYQDCVDNSACTGASTCNPAGLYYGEYIDGCTAGVANFDPQPEDTSPPCVAACCPTTACCLRMQWECLCTGAVSIWVPRPGFPQCAPNASCPAGDNESLIAGVYTHTQRNACTCGTAPTLPAAWSPPAVAADCCDRTCTFIARAEVVDCVWVVSMNDADITCEVNCVADGGWVADPADPANSCRKKQVFCGSACTGNPECLTDPARPALPADPGAVPAICCDTPSNYCQTDWVITCDTTGWGLPATAGASSCVDACAGDADWIVDCGALSATRRICDPAACIPGGGCTQSSPPPANNTPALLGAVCCPVLSTCQYTYTVVCSGSAWGTPTYTSDGCQSPCTQDTAWQGAGCTRTLVVCGASC